MLPSAGNGGAAHPQGLCPAGPSQRRGNSREGVSRLRAKRIQGLRVRIVRAWGGIALDSERARFGAF